MPGSETAQTGFAWSTADAPERYVEAWHHVLHLGDALDDARLIAEFGCLSGITSDHIPIHESSRVEAYATARVAGGAEDFTFAVKEPTLEHIHARLVEVCKRAGGTPSNTPGMEIVSIRVRRYGRG
jgi:hypothetical protein